MKSSFHSFDYEKLEDDANIVPMSSALSKTERFFKVGPYILWFRDTYRHQFGTCISKKSCRYYLLFGNLYILGSLIIWLFGYKLFPEYLAREGIINRRLGLLITTIIILIGIGIYAHTMMAEILGLNQISDQYAPKSVRIALWLLMVLLGIIFVASIRVAHVYYHKAVQKVEHKAERAEAELRLLKSQISPHFLFNTLNNIYGLAYLRDERAAEMISKLSKLLRYLLYDCDRPKVFLTKEKELIEHYLSIQLLKHEDSRNVDFYHAGIMDNNKIAPMILINFIENCFKHSDLETNPRGWIKIGLEVDKNELSFRTENTFKDEVKDVARDHMGIGLGNSLKLLEANYPGKHEINITKENNVYQLDLKITL